MARSLKSLHLRGYRAFDDFRISDLGRVNLIVGKNNAGKTSILEAIRLLASGGDPEMLARVAVERSDRFEGGTWSRMGEPDPVVDAKTFFHESDFAVSRTFAVATDGELGSVRGEVIKIADLDSAERETILSRVPSFLRDYRGEDLGLRLRGSGQTPPVIIGLTADGQFGVDETLAELPNASLAQRLSTGANAIHITPAVLGSSALAALWGHLLVDGREADIVSALRILEPRIESVHFLPLDSAAQSDRVLIGMEDKKRRVSLGTMGEGVRRLLSLALSLANARSGILTVDEIDTGLHWSVMREMWSLVIRVAVELDVSVFATTHSLDCLRGLRDATEKSPGDADMIRVHSIDTRLDHAVTYRAEDLSIAIEQEIEVRG